MSCIKCKKHHWIKKNHKGMNSMRCRLGMGKETNLSVILKKKINQKLKSSSSVKVNKALIYTYFFYRGLLW